MVSQRVYFLKVPRKCATVASRTTPSTTAAVAMITIRGRPAQSSAATESSVTRTPKTTTHVVVPRRTIPDTKYAAAEQSIT